MNIFALQAKMQPHSTLAAQVNSNDEHTGHQDPSP